MISEGLVTSLSSDPQQEASVWNVSPMGPVVGSEMTHLRLRPFPTSRTYRNLSVHPEGVFHVTDDVLMLAKSAVGCIDPMPPWKEAASIRGAVLTDVCRAYEFQVVSVDDSQERVGIEARITHCHRFRDFFGFNRGKFAVLEAAILATRIHMLSMAQIRPEFERLETLVDKTGGETEHAAFRFLKDYINLSADTSTAAPWN